MEDHEIIQLYWDRDEGAIPATAEKYGRRCAAVARNILGSPEDAEECVSDTWLRAWNAMPPQRPGFLSAFLARITRNLAFNRCAARRAEKRGGGTAPLALEELGDCVSGTDDPAGAWERRELVRALEDFLTALPPEKRRLFLRRYWYADSLVDIAALCGKTENTIAVSLSRLRRQLRTHLEERGFPV